MDDDNKVTLDELENLGNIMKDSLEEACTAIGVTVEKIIGNPLNLDEKEYDRRIWEQMALYCARKAKMMTLNASDIMLKADDNETN